MEATASVAGEQSVRVTDKLFIENTLLRVAGALFCHDKKRAATHTKVIELNRGVTDKNIIIRPDPELGQPGPLAHKLFVALIKKHSAYGRRAPTDISFTKRELMRLIGRGDWGGRQSEQIGRALNEIHYTFIRTAFKQKDKRFIEHSFNIFPEIYLERRERPTDPIEACTVTLARPIIASLQDGHFTCLNHPLMQQLGTIGQALYMRLFFHFANLYDGHHKSRLSFFKRYDDICNEWLGGLTLHTYQSVIERDQLGPHLQQLMDAAFLASYAISPARADGGFVIAFRPGATFFADYDRFYRRARRATATFDFDRDQQGIAEPLKVAYLFVEKRHGRPKGGIPYVSSKDVETAKYLVERINIEKISDFLDYALAEAKKTHFDVQSLGGLKQYVAGYADRLEQKAQAKVSQARRDAAERATQERIDYDRFRRKQADALFASLNSREQARIETEARTKAPLRTKSDGPLAKIIFEVERARITAQRYPSRIPSFETWKGSRRAA